MNAQLPSERGKDFLYLKEFRMILAVYAHYFGGERLNARAFFAHKHVMGAGDMTNQVGQQLVLPVFAVPGLSGCQAFLQACEGLVNRNVGCSASFTQGAASAAAVVDSELFELARCAGYLGGDLTYGFGCCDCHFYFLLRASGLAPVPAFECKTTGLAVRRL